NRDLNVGQIISLAPDTSALTQLLGVNDATLKKVLASWGPGKFDAELNLDGKAFRPDGKPAATLIPPAFGMAGVNNHTWTGGWGTWRNGKAKLPNLKLQGRAPSLTSEFKKTRNTRLPARAASGTRRATTSRVTRKFPPKR